ncbi:3-isopropylmalate dehydrogenase [Anaerophilus nitritogenes]|uniref:3-isopropylmalate dehydrogenase n=1 Tax=Anaerophilus nitritogenes TaxID=2498136 RepID=UPI00101B83B3|nr:3-isopropylmalate dehydrogenase [Anaerophilus nitritogenes]
MNFNISVISGDGIGPDIIEQATKVLNKIGHKFGHQFKFIEVDAGGIAIDKFGEPLPQKTLDICKSSDSILLGAVGGHKWDTLPVEKRPEKALLGLRSELGLYANLRPAVLYDTLKDACPLKDEISSKGIDFIVVRELTGGMYFGERGIKETHLGQAAWDTEMYAVEEVRRIAKTAFDIAMLRNKKVTNIDKANVLASSRLWRSVILEVKKDYPQVELDHLYVDNATMQLIKNPSSFDVIVTTNMFGDIISDEASQITGSIGIIPSASLGKSGLGMYEPIHGSAPDIAGKDLANPIATILSAAMMLKYSFQLEEEATTIEIAVFKVLENGYRTKDIMSIGKKQVGTKEMGQLITDEI